MVFGSWFEVKHVFHHHALELSYIGTVVHWNHSIVRREYPSIPLCLAYYMYECVRVSVCNVVEPLPEGSVLIHEVS